MFTATPDQVADLLDSAADLLLVTGWHQGSAISKSGARCIVSATGWSAIAPSVGYMYRIREQRHIITAARAALCAHLGFTRPDQLITWNDSRQRTFDDVLDALRDTAKRVREGEIVPVD